MCKKWLSILLACMIATNFVFPVMAMAGTPEIIIDGVIVQESETPAILEACEKFQAQLQADIAAGNYWFYCNTGKYSTGVWERSLAEGKRGCSCALLALWAVREAGIVGQDEGCFFGLKGGKIGGKGKNQILKKFDDYNVAGTKTVNQLLSEGVLQPGDILTYVNMNHTNIYAGNNKWYDGGHAYCNGSGEGAVFRSWYGDTVYGDQPVGHVLRLKEDDIVIKDITPDIVIRDIELES